MQNLSVCGLGQVQDMRIKEDKMRLQILTVTTSMFILASGMAAVQAQQPPVTSGPDADRHVQQGQRAPPDRYSRDEEI